MLDKAAAWAAARKVNEADLLNMRLSPDMFSLLRQVRAATDHAANAAGRLSGKELLKFANDETTIAQFKDRIAKTIEYLKSVKQSEVDGTEGKEIKITFPSGQTPRVHRAEPAARQRLPNFYFHTTTAYDIVRQCGVESRQARLHGQSAGAAGVDPSPVIAARRRAIQINALVHTGCPAFAGHDSLGMMRGLSAALRLCSSVFFPNMP